MPFAALRTNFHYVFAEIDQPAETCETVPDDLYTDDWTMRLDLTRRHGADWFSGERSLLLEVRSAVLALGSATGAVNYLLNPRHSGYAGLALSVPQPIPLDKRL